MKKYIYILILISAVAAFFLPFQFLLNFAHDDSFFYIKTAHNLSKGLGSTFDGVNLTNGYHPLYFIVLVAVYSVTGFIAGITPEFIYRLTVLLHFIILIFTFLLLDASLKFVLKDKFGKLNSALIFVLLSALVFIRDFGLESHLACLLSSAFLYIKAKEYSNGENYLYDKSALIALLFMTRTDFLYSVIPLVVIADMLTCKEKKKSAFVLILFLATIAIIYYSVNYFVFGHIETVSGSILNAFPRVLLIENINNLLIDPSKLYNQFARIVFVFVAVISFAFYYGRNLKNKPGKGYFLVLLGFGFGSVLFSVLHLMFNFYGIREWYMTLPVFVSSACLAIIPGKRKKFLIPALLLSSALFLYVFWGSRLNNFKYVSGYEYSKALEKITNPDDLIYQVDFCGVTGFFSNRSIVNGDGLANSFEYSDLLKKGKIDEFLNNTNVKYYSTYSAKDILKDSVYIDDNFSDKINGKIFSFGKSSLILQMPFKWNHMAFDMEGKWYLFKLK